MKKKAIATSVQMRENFSRYINKAAFGHEETIIMRRGQAVAKLTFISEEDVLNPEEMNK